MSFGKLGFNYSGFGHLGGGSKNITIPNQTFNWVAEGDSITFGLGGKPAYPLACLTSLPGASVTVVTPDTLWTSPLTGGGNITVRDIATSGISALTVDQNYATRGGAQFQAGQVNILSIMIGTNTSGASDTSVTQKYGLIRDYLKKALVTGYSRLIVGTITARNDDGGTLWNSTLSPLNAYLRSLYNSDLQCDGLFDFGNDPRFNSPTAASNPTYYDTTTPPIDLHPNVTGEAAMGSITRPTVIAALQGSTAKSFATPTWSPFDGNNGAPLLSNSNRTTTQPAGTGNGKYSSRGLPGTRTTKVCFEMDANQGSGGAVFPCITNDSFPFNNAAWPGFDVAGNGIAWGGGGVITIGNTGRGTLAPSYAAGDSLMMAIDPVAKLLWCRVNHLGSIGNWNLGGSANPSTGVGGIDISLVPLAGTFDRYYPACGMFVATDNCLSRFAASQMTQPVPSGFSTFA